MAASPDPVQEIPLGSLKRYLTTSGWRKRTLRNGTDLFTLQSDEDIEIVLPEDAQAKDLQARVSDALVTLRGVESREFDLIAKAIRSISYDLLRSRFPESALRHSAIKMRTAQSFLNRIGKVLTAAAHGELHRLPFFQRPSSIASRYAEECLFAHTFTGSFGFAIESPVGPNTLDAGSLVEAAPLERRALIRLAHGLKTLSRVIANDDPVELVDDYRSGLNANALEELTGLIEETQVDALHFDFTFSPEWGVPPSIEPATIINIPAAPSLHALKIAAQRLRAVDYEKRRLIVGKIRTLHSMEETPSDLFTVSGLQDVVVEWESEEFGKRQVRVSLGPEDYLRAAEAHTAGREISVFGELERQPWRLQNARDFRVL